MKIKEKYRLWIVFNKVLQRYQYLYEKFQVLFELLIATTYKLRNDMTEGQIWKESYGQMI